jgi:2-dehydro-3-deoxygalactonokinase
MGARFISCDWGTSTFRLRLVSGSDESILAELEEPAGAKAIFNDLAARNQTGPGDRAAAFSEFFFRKIDGLAGRNSVDLSGLPAVVSGMASSTIGWKELPYASTPFALDGSGAVYECLRLDHGGRKRELFLLSGVATDRDIMRGEETEVMGLMADPAWREHGEAAVMVLPGTHSKHIVLRGGQIIDFRTYMTGELFDVLANASLLRASVQSPPRDPDEFPARESPEANAFSAGVHQAARDGLPASLFRVRTRHVLQGEPPRMNRWFLSGLLIGAELADLVRREDPGPFLLAAPERLAGPYRRAMSDLGLGARIVAVEPAASGLAVPRAHARFLGHLR